VFPPVKPGRSRGMLAKKGGESWFRFEGGREGEGKRGSPPFLYVKKKETGSGTPLDPEKNIS